MPNVEKTPRQTVRIDVDIWQRFGEVAMPDRSTVLRDFVRWYIGEPGVRMPRRPKSDG